MKSIFKTTLVAAAIAGISSVNAATITLGSTTAPKISEEGYNLLGYIDVGDASTTNDIVVRFTAGIAYQETDLLEFTIGGATIANTSQGEITIQAVNSTTFVDITIDADGPDNGTTVNDAQATALQISDDKTKISFRPAPGLEFELGTVYEIRGLRLNNVGSSVTVASRGITVQGTDIDTVAATTVATKSSQFALAATSGVTLNRVIDVENQRKQFVAEGADTTNDSVTFTLTQSADLLAVTQTTAGFTLKGSDLGFLKDQNGALESSKYTVLGGTAPTSGTGTPAVNETNTEFSYTTSGAPTGPIGVQLTADGAADANGQTLTAQSFTADLVYNYTYMHDGSGTHGNSPGSIPFNNQGAGSWTLSGATVNIEFMPFGAGITQFIYVTNAGNVSGDIEMTYIDQSGTMYGPIALDVTATAKSVTSLGPDIVTKLADAGVNMSSGRGAITLVINSPSADIDVTAGYNSRGDRVLVD